MSGQPLEEAWELTITASRASRGRASRRRTRPRPAAGETRYTFGVTARAGNAARRGCEQFLGSAGRPVLPGYFDSAVPPVPLARGGRRFGLLSGAPPETGLARMRVAGKPDPEPRLRHPRQRLPSSLKRRDGPAQLGFSRRNRPGAGDQGDPDHRPLRAEVRSCQTGLPVTFDDVL